MSKQSYDKYFLSFNVKSSKKDFFFNSWEMILKGNL